MREKRIKKFTTLQIKISGYYNIVIFAWGISSIASRRAVRQGGQSPTERSRQSRLVEGQDEQDGEAEPLPQEMTT